MFYFFNYNFINDIQYFSSTYCWPCLKLLLYDNLLIILLSIDLISVSKYVPPKFQYQNTDLQNVSYCSSIFPLGAFNSPQTLCMTYCYHHNIL